MESNWGLWETGHAEELWWKIQSPVETFGVGAVISTKRLLWRRLARDLVLQSFVFVLYRMEQVPYEQPNFTTIGKVNSI